MADKNMQHISAQRNKEEGIKFAGRNFTRTKTSSTSSTSATKEAA
jgi:hypothetical protein